MTITIIKKDDGTVMLHAHPDELARVASVLDSEHLCHKHVLPGTRTRLDEVRKALVTMRERNPGLAIGWVPAGAATDIVALSALVPMYASMDMRPGDWDLLFGGARTELAGGK